MVFSFLNRFISLFSLYPRLKIELSANSVWLLFRLRLLLVTVSPRPVPVPSTPFPLCLFAFLFWSLAVVISFSLSLCLPFLHALKNKRDLCSIKQTLAVRTTANQSVEFDQRSTCPTQRALDRKGVPWMQNQSASRHSAVIITRDRWQSVMSWQGWNDSGILMSPLRRFMIDKSNLTQETRAFDVCSARCDEWRCCATHQMIVSFATSRMGVYLIVAITRTVDARWRGVRFMRRACG